MSKEFQIGHSTRFPPCHRRSHAGGFRDRLDLMRRFRPVLPDLQTFSYAEDSYQIQMKTNPIANLAGCVGIDLGGEGVFSRGGFAFLAQRQMLIHS